MRQYLSEVSQILFMNNLNINPQFIGSQQTHCTIGLHRIDHSEDAMIIVLKIIRERDCHLGTSYGPIGLWWTTHTSSWGQQGWWRSPLWSTPPAGCRNGAPDGLATEQRLAVAEKGFRDCFLGFHDIREFIGRRGMSGGSWGGHPISGRPPGRALMCGGALVCLLTSFRSFSVFFWSKSFIAIGLRLVL